MGRVAWPTAAAVDFGFALIQAVGHPFNAYVVVGAPGAGAGSVSVFEPQSWARAQLLRGAQDNERFGAVVADATMVGAV